MSQPPRRSLGEAISTMTFAVVGAGLALESLGGAQPLPVRLLLGLCHELRVNLKVIPKVIATANHLLNRRL